MSFTYFSQKKPASMLTETSISVVVLVLNDSTKRFAYFNPYTGNFEENGTGGLVGGAGPKAQIHTFVIFSPIFTQNQSKSAHFYTFC